MTKAEKILELSEGERIMFTSELKSLIAMKGEIAWRSRDLNTTLDSLIDDLQEPISKEKAKSVIKRVKTLRDMMSNLQTTIGNINLDFVLKVPR